jgi:ribosomal protein S18 acetylase RimI-like enzyme
MTIAFLPARPEDFEYCQRLYFSGMEEIMRELKLDMIRQAASFREQWNVAEVRIITLDGAKVGWLQSTVRDDALFLAQLFVDGPVQRRGIGTEVMKRLIGEAGPAEQAVTLGVVKSNPAFRLYERLGFRITHEDEIKLFMRREPENVTHPVDEDGTEKPGGA